MKSWLLMYKSLIWMQLNLLLQAQITSKLIKEPAEFDLKSCSTEIARLHSETNLANIDLMNFPFVNDKHWVDVCVNNVFSTVDFFDSALLTNEVLEQAVVKNLVTNLKTVFKDLIIQCKDFELFNIINPHVHPINSPLRDCGFYTIMFMEHSKGRTVPDFREVNIGN